MWRAIGAVGGKSAVAFLQSKIEKGGPEALEAARAVQARREPQLLPMALALAGNPKTDRGVREEMFGLVEVIGGPEARDGLVKIIATDKEELVRYRAYEAALAADKAAAIGPALEALPAGASYKPEDVQDYLVKDIQKIGAPAREATVKALGSKSPVARITAVMALEHVGSRDDVAALQKLSGDKGAPKGFPAGKTVGKEAARVAATLADKKS
jgi:HEAT repeat protein